MERHFALRSSAPRAGASGDGQHAQNLVRPRIAVKPDRIHVAKPALRGEQDAPVSLKK
jgi:hypothetical protein